MSNQDAFPNQGLGQDGLPSHEPSHGLTKLELFSAMAMQGLLSDLSGLRKEGFKDNDIEEFAIMRAKSLIKELSNNPPSAEQDKEEKASGD